MIYKIPELPRRLTCDVGIVALGPGHVDGPVLHIICSTATAAERGSLALFPARVPISPLGPAHTSPVLVLNVGGFLCR
jgi:hypothetical protein